jgi:hypothetical protein
MSRKRCVRVVALLMLEGGFERAAVAVRSRQLGLGFYRVPLNP